MKDTHFCEHHNVLFKKIYIFLRDNSHVTMIIIRMLHNPKVKPILLRKFKEHKKQILNIFKNFKIIMDFYKENNTILKSEIGHFILYYDHTLSKCKIRKDSDYLKFFYTIMAYPKLLTLMEEIFYIMSDYRLCLYFSSPTINFRNTDKETVHTIIQKFYTNQNMLFSMISKVYPGDMVPWGPPIYTGAFACFETLMILKKYYKDPVKACKIRFTYKKQNTNPHIMKRMNDLFTNQLRQSKEIMNPTHFIMSMKKMKYDLTQTVDTLFSIIFEKPLFQNIQDCYIVDSIKIINQKKNYQTGVKIYILVSRGFINTMLCFNKFDI